MTEHDLQNKIMLAIGSGDTRIFRNNVAMAWVGEIVRRTPTTVLLRNPRPLHAGLCTGSSDIIGWHTITVTLDMVGKRIAVFTAIEVKTERGRTTPEQRQFIDAVRSAGGIADVCRSPEDARELLGGFRKIR